MKITRFSTVVLGVVGLTIGAGCSPQRKPVTERDRKEAALHVSEAQFALTLRDWARAEELLGKAVRVAPEGDYWLSLGSTRMRLGNRATAKEAYQGALKAFEDDAARDSTRVEPWLGQAYVLALLGRMDDSRAVVAKAAKRFPNDPKVRSLQDPKQFDQMISDPVFKEIAL